MRWIGMTGLGAALAVLTACAPAATVGSDVELDSEVVAIAVQHNVPGAGTLSVRLFDPVGSWQLLGPVAPAQTETFVIDEEPAAGTYRLVAELPDGRSVSSRPFNLTGAEGVRWNLFSNTVTPVDVEEVDEGEPEGEAAEYR